MSKKALIIGGGFAGASLLIIFLKMKIGKLTFGKREGFRAGVRTFFKGGHPFTFGPRHF